MDATDAPQPGYRRQLERLIAEHRRRRDEWLPQLPADLRALLPLDATPLTEGLSLLADAAGIGAEVAASQHEQAQANAAVLHGRVFGRGASLPRETAFAAFADGARVREPLIARLAEAVDGGELRREAQALLAAAPPPPASAFAEADPSAALPALEAAFAAQERALLLCADRLDAVLGS
jgi:hypothetical protein